MVVSDDLRSTLIQSILQHFSWGDGGGGMPSDSPRVLCYKHSQLDAIRTHQSTLCVPPSHLLRSIPAKYHL